jgi:hypothetical protein
MSQQPFYLRRLQGAYINQQEARRSDYYTINAVRECLGMDPIPGTDDAKPIANLKDRIRAARRCQ